jgi:hypothetical protein
MTGKQNSAKAVDWKEVMREGEDFLRPLIREVIQQVLEAEMEEAVGAEKSETEPQPARLSSWLLQPDASDAGGQAGTARAARSTRTLSHGGVRTVSTQ